MLDLRLFLLAMLAALLAVCASCAKPATSAIPVGHLGISRSLLAHLDAYYGSMEKEHAVLLFGVQEGLLVRVVGIDDARMTKSTRNSGAFVSNHPPGDSRIVGFLHNHPSGSCTPSPTDVESMYKNPAYRVAIVACGRGRFGAALRGRSTYVEFTVQEGYP